MVRNSCAFLQPQQQYQRRASGISHYSSLLQSHTQGMCATAPCSMLQPHHPAAVIPLYKGSLVCSVCMLCLVSCSLGCLLSRVRLQAASPSSTGWTTRQHMQQRQQLLQRVLLMGLQLSGGASVRCLARRDHLRRQQQQVGMHELVGCRINALSKLVGCLSNL